jgi:ribosomal protein L16/L10AE
MGKGKGVIAQWLCRIRRGEIFLEIDGIGKKSLKDIREITKLLPTKFPGKINEMFHPNLERPSCRKKLSTREKMNRYFFFKKN